MEQIQMVQVENLHPHEKNPRIDAAQVTDLVESIREHGIEVPLVAAMHPSGVGYVVLGGHRRLTAALQAGLTEVPVQIRDNLTAARDQLTFIATENLHRDQLTAVEESRLLQDMLDLGMTQAEISKQTALAKKRVSERVKLSNLAVDAGDKLHRGQITVDDALLIAEYSDDPEIADQLNESAGTNMFDWTVSRAKQRREQTKLIEDGKKLAKKHNIRLVDPASDFVGLADLLIDVGWSTPALEKAGADEVTGSEWDALVHAEHGACPGHSARLIRYGPQRGDLQVGCDQVETEHGGATVTEPEPEPANPWDEITPEDFATARLHRQEHLSHTLTDLDVTDEAAELMAGSLAGQCWREYGDDESGIELLQALTGVEGKSRNRRKLKTWPLPLLVWLDKHWWDIASHHRYQSEGRQGSTYWGEQGQLRQLLERTGYQWSEPEQRAILLATGKAHDATDDDAQTDDGTEAAALAEGGEAA